MVLLVICHPSNLQNNLHPGAETRSVPVAADTTSRNSGPKIPVGVPLDAQKLCNSMLLAPESVGRSGCSATSGGASTPPALWLHLRGRATPAQTNNPSMIARGGVVDLSGVMARAKDFWRGYSQPGIQLVEQRPSWLSSLQIMKITRREGRDRTSELLPGVDANSGSKREKGM